MSSPLPYRSPSTTTTKHHALCVLYDDLLSSIFSFLPVHDLVETCQLVNHDWHHLLNHRCTNVPWQRRYVCVPVSSRFQLDCTTTTIANTEQSPDDGVSKKVTPASLNISPYHTKVSHWKFSICAGYLCDEWTPQSLSVLHVASTCAQTLHFDLVSIPPSLLMHSAFTQVTHLILGCVPIYCKTSMHLLSQCFPQLQHLHIYYCEWRWVRDVLLHAPPLRKLILTNLCRSVVPSTDTTTTNGYHLVADVISIKDLIQAIIMRHANTLVKLKCQFERCNRYKEHCKERWELYATFLSSCTQLKEINLYDAEMQQDTWWQLFHACYPTSTTRWQSMICHDLTSQHCAAIALHHPCTSMQRLHLFQTESSTIHNNLGHTLFPLQHVADAFPNLQCLKLDNVPATCMSSQLQCNFVISLDELTRFTHLRELHIGFSFFCTRDGACDLGKKIETLVPPCTSLRNLHLYVSNKSIYPTYHRTWIRRMACCFPQVTHVTWQSDDLFVDYGRSLLILYAMHAFQSVTTWHIKVFQSHVKHNAESKQDGDNITSDLLTPSPTLRTLTCDVSLTPDVSLTIKPYLFIAWILPSTFPRVNAPSVYKHLDDSTRQIIDAMPYQDRMHALTQCHSLAQWTTCVQTMLKKYHT